MGYKTTFDIGASAGGDVREFDADSNIVDDSDYSAAELRPHIGVTRYFTKGFGLKGDASLGLRGWGSLNNIETSGAPDRYEWVSPGLDVFATGGRNLQWRAGLYSNVDITTVEDAPTLSYGAINGGVKGGLSLAVPQNSNSAFKGNIGIDVYLGKSLVANPVYHGTEDYEPNAYAATQVGAALRLELQTVTSVD